MDFNSYRRAFDRSTEVLPARVARIVMSTTTSTNPLARAVAKEFLDEDLGVPDAVIAAAEQTGGRGRLGRQWASPAGGGAFVTRLLPLVDPSSAKVVELDDLPIVVALAVCDLLDDWLPPETEKARLKWPNDVQVNGRKIAGILIEVIGAQQGNERQRNGGVAILGVGVNYALSEVTELPNATSVRTERGAAEIERWTQEESEELGRFTGELALAIERRIETSRAEPDRSNWLDEYAERSMHRPGDRLEWRSGDEVVTGRFARFDSHGHLCLLLDHDDGGEIERTFAAGEVVESATE